MNNSIKKIYFGIKLITIVFLLLFISYCQSFDSFQSYYQIGITIFFNILLSIDIILQFNIAIEIKEEIIFNRISLAKNYLKGQFIEEALFLISLIIVVNTSHISIAIIHYTIGIIILLKVCKKFEEQFDFIILCKINYILKLFVFVNIIPYVMACIYHYVGFHVDDFNTNWIDTLGIRGSPVYARYIYAYYWSITNLLIVGSSSVYPTNHLEMVVSIFATFLACRIILSLISSFKQKEEMNSRRNSLIQYCKQRNIKIKLQEAAKQSLKSINDDQQTIEKITSKITQNYGLQLLQSVKVVAENFSAQTIKKSSKLLQTQSYNKGQIIIQQSKSNRPEAKNINQQLFLIDEGCVQVIELKSQKILVEYGKGQAFGFFQFFTDESPKFSVICKSKTRVFYLDRYDFLGILMENERDSFFQIRESYELNIPTKYMNCYLCNSNEHCAENCKLQFYEFNFSFSQLEETRTQQRMLFIRQKQNNRWFGSGSRQTRNRIKFIIRQFRKNNLWAQKDYINDVLSSYRNGKSSDCWQNDKQLDRQQEYEHVLPQNSLHELNENIYQPSRTLSSVPEQQYASQPETEITYPIN